MKIPATFRMMAAFIVLLGWSAAGQTVYTVSNAQSLQNALTLAAASTGSNLINVASGYYTGNFNYNSSNVNELTVQALPGVSNTQITIDSGGTGSSMNIAGSATANITVQGMTFLRNCGSAGIGGLKIAGGNTTILVNGCLFLSPTNSSGIGLQLSSGLNATVSNCTAAGTTSGGGGFGIAISGVTGIVNVENCMVTTNNNSGIYVTGVAVISVTKSLFAGNSSTSYPYGSVAGAGVYCSGTTVTLTGNSFLGNSTSHPYTFGAGGGAWCSGTTIALSGNTFISNSDTGTESSSGGYGAGGGAYCSGTTITLFGNSFTSNSTTGETGGSGGGTFCSGTTVTLTGNTFTANSASGSVYTSGANGYVGSAGGGGAFCSGTIMLSNNIFTSNSIAGSPAFGVGGGADCYSSFTNPMTISGNLFKQNAALTGGGIYATASTINLLDNLVVNNAGGSISSQGGGIWVDASATLNMINNTVTGNTSPGSGGGVAYIVTGTVELLNIYNNIIWGNSATVNGGDVYLSGTGKKKVFDYNDVNSIYGVFDIALNDTNVSPQFFNPVSGDYHTQSTSPCIAAGTTNAPSLPAMDLDGNPRVINGLVDMGCYEFTTNVFHPADLASAWTITPGEFTAYAAAWKSGQSWTNAPNPIPANYMTRAGYLMTNGGSYYNDGSARPVNWKTNQ
jgi:hypothetical protein